MAAHLDSRTNIAWVGISKTMREAVAKELMKAIADGDDLKTRIDRIRATASQMGEIQARRIARTEATASMNFGQQAERVDAEIEHKEWVSVFDSRTRTAAQGDAFDHLAPDGQVVRNEGFFVVSGQRLRFPGDSSLGASAGNVINCRCAAVAAWPDEPLDATGAAPVTLPSVRGDENPSRLASALGVHSGVPDEVVGRLKKSIGKGVSSEKKAVRVGGIVAAEANRQTSGLAKALKESLRRETAAEKMVRRARDDYDTFTSPITARDYEEAKEQLQRLLEDRIVTEQALKDARSSAVRDILRSVREMGGQAIDLQGATDLVVRANMAAQHYPRDWVKRIDQPINVRAVNPLKNESVQYAPKTRTLVLSSDPGLSDDLHELMHVMEDFVPIGPMEEAHKLRRAKEAGATALEVVGMMEDGTEILGYKGVFPYDYMGAVHTREDGSHQDVFHELLTVGWESLVFPDKPWDVWEDRETRNFILGVLAGA